MREKSSNVFTSRNSLSPLRLTTSSWPLAAGVNSVPLRESSSSTGPSMSVSGVRNSWLTLLKKAVFARSNSAKTSVRRRSSSYARALATAVVIAPPSKS